MMKTAARVLHLEPNFARQHQQKWKDSIRVTRGIPYLRVAVGMASGRRREQACNATEDYQD